MKFRKYEPLTDEEREMAHVYAEETGLNVSEIMHRMSGIHRVYE